MDAHLRDLRYFVAVADELHFTRAAERLHVSQPALSKQIRLLERNLGFDLFRRDHRAVVLTEAGEALLAPARNLLGSWDDAAAEAARRAREAARVLRVGFRTSAVGGLYGNAIAAFRDSHPGWSVELRLHPWSDATTGLRDRTSDVAFVWRPITDPNLIESQTLRSEARCVAMWRDHPLACRTEVQMAELLDQPFVALPPSAGILRSYWLAVEDRGGHPVRIGAQVESPDATFEAVAAKQGVALLAAGNAELYSRPDIVSLPVTDLAPAELAVAWRADDSRAVLREFTRAAVEAAARSVPPGRPRHGRDG